MDCDQACERPAKVGPLGTQDYGGRTTYDVKTDQDDEIDILVTLRMNRDFLQHMQLYYPEVIKSTHPTYVTVVSEQDLLDQNTKQ